MPAAKHTDPKPQPAELVIAHTKQPGHLSLHFMAGDRPVAVRLTLTPGDWRHLVAALAKARPKG